MLRLRTIKDNRQLALGEVQIESVQGAISAYPSGVPGVLRITTVRGIPSRLAQFADLDLEALGALIDELKGYYWLMCNKE